MDEPIAYHFANLWAQSCMKLHNQTTVEEGRDNAMLKQNCDYDPRP